ncbi:MAG: hypothetical protein ABL932_25190 [Terricaulis sp.]
MIAPGSTFTLRLRHGIWRVTLNGAFFADYRSEADARDGVAQATRHMTSPAKLVLIVSDEI